MTWYITDKEKKQNREKEDVEYMPWYWILVIISAIVGPFEAMHALNKARRNREEAEKRRASNGSE